MKKSLLALAAMSAFAGAAQAQSSVSVYGIIDAGFLSTNGTSGAANAAGAATTAGSANGGKRVTSALTSGMLSTSRLGLEVWKTLVAAQVQALWLKLDYR